MTDVSPDTTLEMAEEYRDPIRDGEKSASVRYRDAAHVRVGDVTDLVTPDRELIARVLITQRLTVYAEEALAVLEHLTDVEYPTEDTDELLDALNHHYSDEVTRDSIVDVVAWDVLDRDPKPDGGVAIPTDDVDAKASIGHLQRYTGTLDDGHARVESQKRMHRFGSGTQPRGPSRTVWSGTLEEAERLHRVLDGLLAGQDSRE